MRHQMKKGRNQKGFTLVELMVVVVIIGILSAIAVPVYSSVTEKAEKSACQANQRMLEGAVNQYLIDNPDKTIDDVDDMTNVNSYFTAAPTCPSEGTYTITDGIIKCDKHAHY